MECRELEPLIEAIADGSLQPDARQSAHLDACPACAASLAAARRIEHLLSTRDVPAPAATFTALVMARIGHERLKAERVIDLGFNLAIAAGVLFILASGAGLAWSLGFLTVSIDVDTVWQAFGSEMTGKFLSQLQTVVMAAALLTTALVLWWWAEAASSE